MTPIRRQYLKIKQRYPDAIVFFRLGDFYETFDEDAKVTARELEITLTSKPMGKGLRVPLAGIPYHAIDSYLGKLIGRGYKVAICEQLSDPATAKGLVERDVVRLVTPGTVVEPNLLEAKANNYLAALVAEGEEAGIAYVDITTGEFGTTQLPAKDALSELERLQPAELLLPAGLNPPELRTSIAVTHLDDWQFSLDVAKDALLEHFSVASLEGYGCERLPLAMRAAGSILNYLKATQKGALAQLTRLTTYSISSFMTLDAQTRRNLELFQSTLQGTTSGSLLSVIDLTKTAMGGRLLKRWLGQPSLDLSTLIRRQELVEWFATHAAQRTKISGLLGQVADLERLVNRIRGNIANSREVMALRRGLERVPEMVACLRDGDLPPALTSALDELRPCEDVVDLITQAIADDPPANLSEGGVVKRGFSVELDAIETAAREAKRYLASLEREERQRTGIKSLRVGYNKVFGYYIEVSKPNLNQVPSDYIRKQTLVGGERYFTLKLKEYESLILNAQDKIVELETAIFHQVCHQIGAASGRILATAAALAEIDVLIALAEVAVRYSYVRPRLTEDETIVIADGRHPVVERALSGESFVPNDTYLSNSDAQIIVLTGPNMSGKSTYLRQVALIVLLAQIGSFVPASSAQIGLVDRIFTRVGAQDDLATGRSTFMVEMLETANILHNATPRSLIILDEIGRGTSTYDGLSIAQAVVEYLHNHPRLGAKTLFATHYHELVEVANLLPRVKNFNVAVTEEGGRVVFLRRIIPGGADKSYGIHVAQLAGLPRPVIHRAQEVLAGLERNGVQKLGLPKAASPPSRRNTSTEPAQLPLFGTKPLLIGELLDLDISSLTPLEAITKLYELQRKAKEA